MAITTLKDLLEAGVHFGTNASLWHPRNAPNIYGKRGGIHIIDIKATAKGLIQAYYYAAKLAKANKTLLFVGTKRQAKDVVRESARAVGMLMSVRKFNPSSLKRICLRGDPEPNTNFLFS